MSENINIIDDEDRHQIYESGYESDRLNSKAVRASESSKISRLSKKISKNSGSRKSRTNQESSDEDSYGEEGEEEQESRGITGSIDQSEAGEEELEESAAQSEDPAMKRRRERALQSDNQPTSPNVEFVYSNIGESIQDDDEIEAFEKSNSEGGKKKVKSVAFSNQSAGEVSEEE